MYQIVARLGGRAFVATGLLALATPGLSFAQSTAGSIFGHGPAGQTVTVTSPSGSQRHVVINGKGRYTVSPVSAGTYSVVLEKDGAVVDTRKNIPITIGRGAQIDFACPNDNCGAAE